MNTQIRNKFLRHRNKISNEIKNRLPRLCDMGCARCDLENMKISINIGTTHVPALHKHIGKYLKDNYDY